MRFYIAIAWKTAERDRVAVGRYFKRSNDLCGRHTTLDLPFSTIFVYFCRVDYVLSVCTQGEEFLTVELEQEYNAFRWRGDFTAECTLRCFRIHSFKNV